MAKSIANGDEPSEALLGTWYVKELMQENKILKKLVNDLQLEIEKAVLLSREIHELEEK